MGLLCSPKTSLVKHVVQSLVLNPKTMLNLHVCLTEKVENNQFNYTFVKVSKKSEPNLVYGFET